MRAKVDLRSRQAAPALPARDEEAARRDRAMAQFILRRVGIAPLAPSLVMILFMANPPPANAEPGPVRATALATARATILPSSVRIEQGRIILTGTSPAASPPTVQPTIRACDPAPPANSRPCRMIVYDMP